MDNTAEMTSESSLADMQSESTIRLLKSRDVTILVYVLIAAFKKAYTPVVSWILSGPLQERTMPLHARALKQALWSVAVWALS